jgi:hypothetical protein
MILNTGSTIGLNATNSLLNEIKCMQSSLNPNTTINYSTNIGNICLTNTNGNNSNGNSSIGLTIDHQQLLQISQLMNEMQNNTSATNSTNMDQTDHLNHHQQHQECITLGDSNQSHSTSLSNLMEIVVTSPRSASALASTTQGNMMNSSNNTNNQQQQNNTYYSNSLVLSPSSLNKYDAQTLQYATTMPTLVNSQQIFTIAQPQSQQQQQQQAQIIDANSLQQQQVHTIMLNGQPALFIPASSAMSSNLLCQMLMNQNNNQSTTSTNNSSTTTTTTSSSSATNSNDLFANEQFETANSLNSKLNANNSLKDDNHMIVNLSGTQHHHQQSQHHSFINLS